MIRKIYCGDRVVRCIKRGNLCGPRVVPECEDRFSEPVVTCNRRPIERRKMYRRNYALRTRISPVASGTYHKEAEWSCVVRSRIRYRLYVQALLNKRVTAPRAR